MFENATHFNVRPGMMRETIKILRTSIIPLLRRQPGLLSLALIPQPGQNQLTILSIWTTLIYARAIEKDPHYRQEIRKLDHAILDMPPFTGQAEKMKGMEYQALSLN